MCMTNGFLWVSQLADCTRAELSGAPVQLYPSQQMTKREILALVLFNVMQQVLLPSSMRHNYTIFYVLSRLFLVHPQATDQ
ncbi:hypothetical protein L227DRAFT_580287 [Lentinus tigrinus ALCF2SS1-6]|uniref:Uncharacterized protein n=1 Tax=Lentinus tigrinus ALCF2SS1-6 TaxID=1328759 RepID=A0A5C2RSX4_9APHY|nr:hypothetical protein L227DRAFT_580287 [Lentinus tigrinus ALCF2SS1-6]